MNTPRWVVVVTGDDGTKSVYGPADRDEAEQFAADLTGPESDSGILAEPMILGIMEP